MTRTKNFKAFAVLASLAAAIGASLLILSILENPAHAAADDQSVDAKIVNGQPADPGEYPAQGYLQIEVSPGSFGVCGGTLVAKRKFLTAAHCVDDQGTILPPSSYLVVLGEVDLNNIGQEDKY